MRDNRDMFYSNYQAGGFQEPNMIMTPPQGYNMTQNYQAYGPNVMPINNMVPNQMGTTNSNNYIDEYDQRITKLERQIRRIDQRLRKLENSGTMEEINIDSNNIDTNMYMI